MGILFIVLLLVVGLILYRLWSQGKLDILKSDRDQAAGSPEEILKRRLAEGVIDQKEYDRILRTIRS